MTPTAIMTPMAWIARRRVKASMNSFHCSLAAGGGRRGRLEKKSPGSSQAAGTCVDA
jgi:hypothetical protein